jgi:hypothetical protein
MRRCRVATGWLLEASVRISAKTRSHQGEREAQMQSKVYGPLAIFEF